MLDSALGSTGNVAEHALRHGVPAVEGARRTDAPVAAQNTTRTIRAEIAKAATGDASRPAISELCVADWRQQLTPFEATRGRLPRLVSDNPLLDSELPERRSIEEHVTEMEKLMELARHELKAAKDKSMRDNRDLQNLKRVDECFVEGEIVLFYNRLIGSEGNPSKLRLRTYLYRVLSREGDIYQLQSVQFPDSTRRVHVGQLISFKGDVEAMDIEEAEAERQRQQQRRRPQVTCQTS